MKIPKHFMGWFRIYGLMNDDIADSYWQVRKLEKIAWRCYRKGVADMKEKYGIIKRSVPQEHS